ncbi:hypothetical protein KUTeg_010941 [Tegillarca granosa]|uniref:Uncharacterized protein n=1 Tax=Tegillarca granosa TaxID=220873 RepID=A0ABQ9F2H1_TEGGR|nr:hypothetical protein KUTeg_010941 [Tegillarca granosa]
MKQGQVMTFGSHDAMSKELKDKAEDQPETPTLQDQTETSNLQAQMETMATVSQIQGSIEDQSQCQETDCTEANEKDHDNPALSESESDDISSDIYPMLYEQNKNITFLRSSKNSKGNLSNKVHACIYCKQVIANISRHLQIKHRKENEVAKILTLEKKSLERRKQWEKLVNKGDFSHNMNVLKKGKGIVIPKYRIRHKSAISTQDYVSCKDCKGYYRTNDLSKHQKMCVGKNEKKNRNRIKCNNDENCVQKFGNDNKEVNSYQKPSRSMNVRKCSTCKHTESEEIKAHNKQKQHSTRSSKFKDSTNNSSTEKKKEEDCDEKETDLSEADSTHEHVLSEKDDDWELENFSDSGSDSDLDFDIEPVSGTIKKQIVQRLKKKIMTTLALSESESDDDSSDIDPVLSEQNKNITIMRSSKNSKGNLSNKVHACIYCKKVRSNISRHLEIKHSKENEVAKILTLEKKSLERRKQWEKLVNKGDFSHNMNVLKKGKGIVIPKYRTSKTFAISTEDYVSCKDCKGYYRTNDLSKHQKMCVGKNEKKNRNSNNCNIDENCVQKFGNDNQEHTESEEIKAHSKQKQYSTRSSKVKDSTNNNCTEKNKQEDFDEKETDLSESESEADSILEEVISEKDDDWELENFSGSGSDSDSDFDIEPVSEALSSEDLRTINDKSQCHETDFTEAKEKDHDKPALSEKESDDDSSDIDPVLSEQNKNVTIMRSSKNSKGNLSNKVHACIYCKQVRSNISRHLEIKHRKEKEVAKILTLEKKSIERRKQWEKLVNKGDFSHNMNVLKKGKGIVIPKYRTSKTKSAISTEDYVSCKVCKGYYRTNDLGKHQKMCVGKKEKKNRNRSKCNNDENCVQKFGNDNREVNSYQKPSRSMNLRKKTDLSEAESEEDSIHEQILSEKDDDWEAENFSDSDSEFEPVSGTIKMLEKRKMNQPREKTSQVKREIINKNKNKRK